MRTLNWKHKYNGLSVFLSAGSIPFPKCIEEKVKRQERIIKHCTVQSYTSAYLLVDTEKDLVFLLFLAWNLSLHHIKKISIYFFFVSPAVSERHPASPLPCISPSKISVFSNIATLSMNLDDQCRVTPWFDQGRHNIAIFVTKIGFPRKTEYLAASSYELISLFRLFYKAFQL